MIILKNLFYYGVLIPVSILPFRVLYVLSDLTYLVLYKIIGYRRDVVTVNLKKSFPEKSSKELKDIEQKSYRHLCDIIMEAIKGFTISEKELNKRFTYSNPELINDLHKQQKSVVAITGHYNSWEYCALTVGLTFNSKVMAVFQPMSDSFFNDKMKKSREKFNVNFVAPNKVGGYFAANKNNITLSCFVADQTPSNIYKSHWMTFLNQETPVFLGAERMAKEYNFPVVFAKISKIKRGYYQTHLQLICEDPSTEQHTAITEKHTRLLEKVIQDAPEFWLWTHRRWKRKKPVDFKPLTK